MSVEIGLAGGLSVALLGTLGYIVTTEYPDWGRRLARYLIRVAAMGLPADERDDRLQEWDAELAAVWAATDKRCTGLTFAAWLFARYGIAALGRCGLAVAGRGAAALERLAVGRRTAVGRMPTVGKVDRSAADVVDDALGGGFEQAADAVVAVLDVAFSALFQVVKMIYGMLAAMLGLVAKVKRGSLPRAIRR